MFINPVITQELILIAQNSQSLKANSVHGLSHWLKVEKLGLQLADQIQSDRDVISLFALFHDSCRENDFTDLQHGARASQLLCELFYQRKLPLSPEQFNLLNVACRHHTDTTFHSSSTIACCWDADRLDLTRIGVYPDPELLNTEPAKKLAVRISII